MPDNKKLNRNTRENLLGELENVKDLLNDEEMAGLDTEQATLPAIPALEDKPATPASAQESLFPPAPEEIPDISPSPMPRSGKDNPFLSPGVKEKLAKSQSKAHKELNQLLGSSNAPVDRRKPENWKKAQQHLRAKSSALLQEIIEEALPGIESELRNRLQLEMDLFLEEMQQQED